MEGMCECGHPSCWNGLSEAEQDSASALVHLMAAVPISDVAAAATRLGSADAALLLLAAEEDWDEDSPRALGADWIAGRLGWLPPDSFHRAVDVLTTAGRLAFDGEVITFERDDTAGSVERFLRGH